MRIFRLLMLAAFLAASVPCLAQDAAESISADVLLAQALENSPDILSAKNTLAQAKLTYQATLAFKATSLSANASGSYSTVASGNQPAGFSGKGDLSIAIPLNSSFSLGASAKVDGSNVSASASANWNPLASSQTAKDAKVNYELALASYEQALRDVKQSASEQIISFMDASNALISARESLALANISLLSAQTKQGLGQSSATELLKAEKSKASADRAVARADSSLDKARASLALTIGGEPGKRIEAGAGVSLEGLSSAEDWAAPAFSELPKKRSVLQAEANLAKAKNTVLNGGTKGEGPLKLSASVDTNLKISLSGNYSLGLSEIDGSDAASKKLTVEAAQLALDKARYDAQTEYQNALDSAKDALLALKDAELQLRIDAYAADAAKVKWDSQAMTELEYRGIVNAQKDSAAKVASARLSLVKARAWFVAQ
jgi:outer membrane protein TolC